MTYEHKKNQNIRCKNASILNKNKKIKTYYIETERGFSF